MVSVIIPCYNAVQYIDKCMDALSAQTFKDFKVILVDDCSTDDTYQQLCQLQEKYNLNVKVLQNSINSGPATSRNNGILAADTKYITFCDIDDWYEPDFLETLVSLLETNSADIAFCGYKVVDEYGKYQLRPITNKGGVIRREEAFCLDADSLCMLMVRTDIMKQTLLPNLRNGEDIATVPLLMARSNCYATADKCLYNYFRRRGSASETPSIKVVDSLLTSFQFISKYFPQVYSKELEFIGIKTVLYSAVITLFTIGKYKSKAIEILESFEKNFPNWRVNPYISSLRIYKKVIIKFVSLRLWGCVRFVAILRHRLYK